MMDEGHKDLRNGHMDRRNSIPMKMIARDICNTGRFT